MGADDYPELTIIHFNDFHSHFEPVDLERTTTWIGETACKKEPDDACVGGFARMHAKIKELKKTDPNALVVNAGDVFTGTPWFDLLGSNVVAEFMNTLSADVQIIGNHEFDPTGVQAVIDYLKLIHKTPTVVSNIDASHEPDLEPFLCKSTVIEKNGLKIGVVGYVTTDYKELAKIGDLIIQDEVSTTREAIKNVRAQKADIVVAVSHTGYERDKLFAESLDVDIIVGAHSHTLLYTGPPLSSHDQPMGPYPTIVTQPSGRRVLIIHAGAFSKYIGYLKVKFEKKDNTYQVASWAGNPILLDKTVQTDTAIEAKLQTWREQMKQAASTK